tara:strand:- start:22 stop:558 length:537 start_codon:yes stop_codon:yes gene_type:complete
MAVIEAIASAYLEATATSVVFTGIPQTYEHLQLRVSARDDGAGSDYSEVTLRFGPVGGSIDTGNNYYSKVMYAHNTTIGAEAQPVADRLRCTFIAAPNDDAAQFGGGVIDIMDYRNTNKNTSAIWHGGNALAPTYPWIEFGGGLWDATGAIDQISVAGYAHGSLLRGSEFTLYGLNSS